MLNVVEYLIVTIPPRQRAKHPLSAGEPDVHVAGDTGGWSAVHPPQLLSGVGITGGKGGLFPTMVVVTLT